VTIQATFPINGPLQGGRYRRAIWEGLSRWKPYVGNPNRRSSISFVAWRGRLQALAVGLPLRAILIRAWAETANPHAAMAAGWDGPHVHRPTGWRHNKIGPAAWHLHKETSCVTERRHEGLPKPQRIGRRGPPARSRFRYGRSSCGASGFFFLVL